MADAGAVDSVMPGANSVTIDAAAGSIAQARRLVVTQLQGWGLGELSDDARLVVSELLTNAALHAQPPVRLQLVRLAEGVRIEVSDASKDTPLLVRAGTDVMTGRGWTLVEALCEDWGVIPRDHGKTVWATLMRPTPGPGDRAADASVDPAAVSGESHTVSAELLALAAPRPDESADERYEVSLGDVPTELLIGAKAHIDALIREFALMASGASGAVGGRKPVPVELTTLIERVVGNFSEARQSIKRQALRAAEHGEPRTQLSLYLPLSAADAGLAYLAALDEVDAYCRAEQMLTLESPREHRIFRRWYVEGLVAGLRRAAYPDTDAGPVKVESFEARLQRDLEGPVTPTGPAPG